MNALPNNLSLENTNLVEANRVLCEKNKDLGQNLETQTLKS